MQASSPQLSVLMPVHNGERFLRDAIESVLAQTFTDFELILVDDGSTDGTAEILRDIDDPRLRVLRNASNLGLARSLNRGLEAVRGPVVARMDADDLCHPERFAAQIGYLDGHPAVGLVATDYSLMDAGGAETGTAVLGRDLPGPELEWRLFWENPIVHPSVMIRTELLRRNGGYSEAFRHYAEDLDLWHRLAPQTEMVVLGRVLLRLRKHDRNVTVMDQEDHLGEVVGAVQVQLAARLGWEPSAASIRLLRRLPLPTPASATDLRDACRLLREASASVHSRHPGREADLRRVRADHARRLLRLPRLPVSRSRFQALGIFGEAFSVAPAVTLSSDGLKALATGILGPRGLPGEGGPP